MPRRLQIRFGILAATFMLLAATGARADGHSMSISIVFPDGRELRATLDHPEVVQLTGQKPIYMLDFWAYAALKKLSLPYETHSVESPPGVAITSIDGLANGEHEHWVYFANGIRSPYRLNTQLFEGIERLELRFEPAQR